jgi:hypothetical protein
LENRGIYSRPYPRKNVFSRKYKKEKKVSNKVLSKKIPVASQFVKLDFRLFSFLNIVLLEDMVIDSITSK